MAALCGNYQLVPTSQEVLEVAKRIVRQAKAHEIGPETAADVGERLEISIKLLTMAKRRIDAAKPEDNS